MYGRAFALDTNSERVHVWQTVSCALDTHFVLDFPADFLQRLFLGLGQWQSRWDWVAFSN